MAKKAEDESLNLYYSEEKQKKKNAKNRKKNSKKVKEPKSTKDEKINLDNEIIIGLKQVNKKQNTKNNKKPKKSVAQDRKAIHNAQKNTKKKPTKKVVEKKLTQKQELARKKRKAIFKIIKWTSLVIIILGAIIATLLSPIFNIENIEVSGNSKISVEEITSLSAIQKDTNMFKYRKKDIVNSVKENAYIDTVEVKRKYPDTMQIIVTEREATFIIPFANAYAYINNQGYILEISEHAISVPILEGTATLQEDIQVGSRLSVSDLEKLSDVLKIMESSVSNGLEKDITKINITDEDDYILTLQSKNKVVHLGDTSNLSTKMLWIIAFNESEGNTKGEIMLNMNLNDKKPYFRKEVKQTEVKE